MYKLQILFYDRIDVSKGIDVDKTSKSKECDICHYWYFLDKASKFQTNVCKIAIPNIHGADYRCIISGISKCEAMDLMQNIDLTKKEEQYKT